MKKPNIWSEDKINEMSKVATQAYREVFTDGSSDEKTKVFAFYHRQNKAIGTHYRRYSDLCILDENYGREVLEWNKFRNKFFNEKMAIIKEEVVKDEPDFEAIANAMGYVTAFLMASKKLIAENSVSVEN